MPLNRVRCRGAWDTDEEELRGDVNFSGALRDCLQPVSTHPFSSERIVSSPFMKTFSCASSRDSGMITCAFVACVPMSKVPHLVTDAVVFSASGIVRCFSAILFCALCSSYHIVFETDVLNVFPHH